MTPLAIDLFCGLGGWTDGLLAEGYDVVGFDIERHEYGEHRYPAQLVVQDVLTLHGSQFRDASLIVASPPCQAYSWMAMPWSRARQVAAALRGDGEFPVGYRGSRTVADLNRLFDACFRIQREASEAAGRHIPLVVENVRGAQPWVGPARWHFGSFYLWGDVPALMPIVSRSAKQDREVLNRDGHNVILPQVVNREGTKVPGLDWNGYRNGDPNYRGQAFNPAAQGKAMQEARAIKNTGGSRFAVAHNTTSGKGRNPDGRKGVGARYDPATGNGAHGMNRWTNPVEGYGRKNPGIELGDIGFNVASAHQFGHMVDGVKIERSDDDKRQHIGVKRKFASAMIAKIPLPLSRWIARAYYPCERVAA